VRTLGVIVVPTFEGVVLIVAILKVVKDAELVVIMPWKHSISVWLYNGYDEKSKSILPRYVVGYM
jgi:hypothetical protein